MFVLFEQQLTLRLVFWGVPRFAQDKQQNKSLHTLKGHTHVPEKKQTKLFSLQTQLARIFHIPNYVANAICPSVPPNEPNSDHLKIEPN